MELSVGTVVEGKVKQITKFGAFILLPDSFVNDIHDHLTEGQTVNVLVIGNENGKVNLSIKRTLEPPAKPQFSRARPQGDRAPSDRPQGDRPQSARPQGERPAYDRRRTAQPSAAPAAPQAKSFDDMLKQFMTESDSKISSLRQYSDRKTKSRRR